MLIWLPNTGAGGTQYVIQFREANIADTASFNTSAPVSLSDLIVYAYVRMHAFY